MSRTKTSNLKSSKDKAREDDLETESDQAEIVETKSKKPIDLESALEPATIVDEKIEEDVSIFNDDSEESSSDELSLDDEEINPFGDKWEQ